MVIYLWIQQWVNWLHNMAQNIKIDRNFLANSIGEEIEKKTFKEKFFGYFRDENINLEYLINNRHTSFSISERGRFNIFIRRMKILFEIDLNEMLIYFDEEGYELEKIVRILSYENTKQIEIEISKKFRLKKNIKDSNDSFVK